jgi:tyrosinase
MVVRVRRDVWKLGTSWADPILWYARAVAAMQKRPITDPTSWRYQAAIHEYFAAEDPLAQPGEQLPSSADQRRFWTQCQHQSWYFLPWHRMYLLYFEQIVAATVVQLHGPADWALPYWNYSGPANTNVRKLPTAFTDVQTPDHVANPLRVERRQPLANSGGNIGTDRAVSLDRCLPDPRYIGRGLGGDPGFGGPRTAFNHGGGRDPMGYLEQTPHGSMHGAVGGATGWMSSFTTAALDPIFWLHHGNIDRLWNVWRKRAATHVNPPDAQWLTSRAFEFHDATRAIVSLTPNQVVDTTAALLNYRYEDESDPLAGRPDTRALIPVAGLAMQPEPEPVHEMVGATEQPLALTGQAATTRLSVSAPSGPARAAFAAQPAAVPEHIYLNIENVTGTRPSTSYAVYINLPPGEDPEQHQDLFAGLLPMFGVVEATRADTEHSGSGLHYSLDIGDVVRTLDARHAWDPNDMRVTFVPEYPEPEPERGLGIAAAPEPIQVGRVSLYYGSAG